MTLIIKANWALAIALLLSACEQQSPTQEANTTDLATPDDLLWNEGADGSKSHLGKDIVIKCWPLGKRFDCLYAQISDIRDQIADAPVYWSFYRFMPFELPKRTTDLEKNQTMDGYACSATRRGNTQFVSEEIWKNGEIAEEQKDAQQAYQSSMWSARQVSDFFKEYSVTPYRPYFACAIVNELVQHSGLGIVDTPVLSYESIMQADRFEAPSGSSAEASEIP